MKRFLWLLLMMLTLAACIHRTPTPTDSPMPTVLPSPTALPSSTPTPLGSPVPRITIVPSATRIEPPVQVESTIPTASPTSTVVVLPTLTPSDTPTPRVVDAGPTATPQPSPTATPSQSPLPTPSPIESPLEPPSTVTPSLTPDEGGSNITPSPSAAGEAWLFEKVFTHYDASGQEFYVAGEVINNTDDHQRVITLMPVVLDENGLPVTSAENVLAPVAYDQLRESISLAPGKGLPFAFKVFLPEDISVEENYEILIEAEPAEPARDDLDILFDDFDRSDWPRFFLVEGSYENPGSSLQDFVAVVVTMYDDDERVIGVGWLDQNENPALLEPGEHDFRVETEMWEIADTLALEVYSYKVQVLGH